MADDNLFAVELVTPERILFSGSASQVILRTADGDITFLTGHTPLVGAVVPGVVRIVREDGEEDRAAVHGGFVQVEQRVVAEEGTSPSPVSRGTHVTLLAGVAELAGEVDVERARNALAAAEARVSELGSSAGRGGSQASGEGVEPDSELAEAEAAVRRAEVRLEAAGAAAAA